MKKVSSWNAMSSMGVTGISISVFRIFFKANAPDQGVDEGESARSGCPAQGPVIALRSNFW